ncbi:GDSL-type esterase/lipase family protein [Nocardioides sp.]|uniref:GDSL-type esterase/lipase family protein n=1 Tax=Nocardioides sp. TaxID=35761 RepID=UPI003D0D8552
MSFSGRRRPSVALLGRALALMLLTTALVTCDRPDASAEDPARILIVGDSVTQGSAGDWTWRYRLWQHLRRQGVAVDLVGPRQDLWDNLGNVPGSIDYLDPEFDTDHAARWGMSFADQDDAIGELIQRYQPDVVVELLGLNDLVWQGVGAEGLHDRVETFVAQARAADPGVDLVVSRIPQTWLKDVPASNERLSDLPRELSTAESRVVVSYADEGFAESADTWDAAHPAAPGEIKIAASVADALASLGIGAPYPRPLPLVPRGPRWAPALTARPGDGQVQLSWVGSPGSDHEYVWLRDVSAGAQWRRLPFPVPGRTWVVTALRNGHDYAFRLQPVKGYHAAAADIRSNVVRTSPRAPRPGPVRGLVVRPARTSLTLTWRAPRLATRNQVRWWPRGHPAQARRRLVRGPALRIGSLIEGRRYVIAVAGLNDTTPGPVRRVVATPRRR